MLERLKRFRLESTSELRLKGQHNGIWVERFVTLKGDLSTFSNLQALAVSVQDSMITSTTLPPNLRDLHLSCFHDEEGPKLQSYTGLTSLTLDLLWCFVPELDMSRLPWGELQELDIILTDDQTISMSRFVPMPKLRRATFWGSVELEPGSVGCLLNLAPKLEQLQLYRVRISPYDPADTEEIKRMMVNQLKYMARVPRVIVSELAYLDDMHVGT